MKLFSSVVLVVACLVLGWSCQANAARCSATVKCLCLCNNHPNYIANTHIDGKCDAIVWSCRSKCKTDKTGLRGALEKCQSSYGEKCPCELWKVEDKNDMSYNN